MPKIQQSQVIRHQDQISVLDQWQYWLQKNYYYEEAKSLCNIFKNKYTNVPIGEIYNVEQLQSIWDEKDTTAAATGGKKEIENEYYVHDKFKDYDSVSLRHFDKDDLYEPNANDREAIKAILKKIN